MENAVPNAADPFEPWSCCAQPPGAITHPDQLPGLGTGWIAAPVPGTAAAALRAAGRWDFARPAELDGEDWWYRTTFRAPELPAGAPCQLCFDGLATLGEVWLNGKRLLTTENMFRAYRIDVGGVLRAQNELVLVFRSLDEDLKRKRPRPRWKTILVGDQQLRWHRTSLLGRILGWSPPVPPVGPWRAVRLDTRPFALADLRLSTRVEDADGVVQIRARIHSPTPPGRAILRMAGREAGVEIRPGAGAWLLSGEFRLAHPPLWWPHTHGEQSLFDCSLDLHVGGERFIVPCGSLGFRMFDVPPGDGFSLQVNGEDVYCRGASWTVSDIFSPGAADESLERDLRLARDAGVNMLRIGGTMVHESDRFYQLCDELGILVWQDFMFANMDYPVEDPSFATNIDEEANYQLSRLSPHPCVAVLCGNSEVEQQAALRGAPREVWRNHWFAVRLPQRCAEHLPDVPYFPSSPSGGALPFHVRTGVAHYYGIGAYLRTPADLRKDDVRFTSECLAFANVPEPATIGVIMDGSPAALHDPRWKQRVPRDTGAGWDFDDVRDYYLQYLFGVDPVQLRSFDMQRYLQLSRVVSGEIMAQVFAEWRSGQSRNRGGLVWLFKDLWPGAGWGIIDSLGIPKAVYYYLRRSWLPRQITLTDEGLDGLHLHVTNESAELFDGHVELLLLKDGHITVSRREVPCKMLARGKQTFTSDALLDGFHDVTYSYRFGPPSHDVAIATLFDEEHRMLSEAFHFIRRAEPAFLPVAQLEVEAELVGEGCYQVTLSCDRFLHSVSFDSPGFLSDDNYFHLTPSRPRSVRLRPLESGNTRFRAHVEALNLRNPVPIPMKKDH